MDPMVKPEGEGDTALTAASLIAGLTATGPEPCPDCRRPVLRRHALMSMAMGFKARPMCLSCLAGRMEQNVDALETHVMGYINRRDCYRAAMEWAVNADVAPRE